MTLIHSSLKNPLDFNNTNNRHLIWLEKVKRRDQGWSWVVFFTSFLTATLCDGSISGFGVVYKNIHNHSNSKTRNYTDTASHNLSFNDLVWFISSYNWVTLKSVTSVLVTHTLTNPSVRQYLQQVNVEEL
ncbi:hypothetical protein ACTXT7_009976 [Hymenolepis weldensis]